MAGKRGGMDFELGFSASGGGANRRQDPERPLRVLIVGDFGGEGNANGKPVVVVPAEIDRAIAKLGISLEFEWEGDRTRLQIRELDSLHPDAIARSLPWMARLLALRKQLKVASTSEAAVREVESLGLLARPSGTAKTESTPAPAAGGSDDLAGLLGRGSGAGRKDQSGPAGVDIRSFIRKVVGDQPGASVPEPGTREALAAIDQRLTAMMRAALRDERFARIESAWRVLHHLASNAWDEERVRFEVMSLSVADAAGLLSSSTNSLQDWIRGGVDDASGPADVVLLVEPVCADEASIERAAHLTKAAAAVGATLILSADASMAGCPGFGAEPDPARWQSTRTQPWYRGWRAIADSDAAPGVAMVMPRWLARRPYGVWSEPIESFTFEELEAGERGLAAGHGSMSWAGGGWLLLRSIVEAWVSDGPDMQLGSPCIVGDLPHAAWKDESGSHALPCAECYLVERAIEAIAELGFVAAASMKGRDAVVLGPIQSIAGGLLRGRWN